MLVDISIEFQSNQPAIRPLKSYIYLLDLCIHSSQTLTSEFISLGLHPSLTLTSKLTPPCPLPQNSPLLDLKTHLSLTSKHICPWPKPLNSSLFFLDLKTHHSLALTLKLNYSLTMSSEITHPWPGPHNNSSFFDLHIWTDSSMTTELISPWPSDLDLWIPQNSPVLDLGLRAHPSLHLWTHLSFTLTSIVCE